MLGRRLVGLARLVVPAPGEPLLALAPGLGPALHVPLPDLGLDHGRRPPAGRRRSRPCAPAARPSGPAAASRSGTRRGPAARRTPRPKGSRATNVDPSGAVPQQGVADRAQHRLPVRRAEVLQPPRQPPSRHHHLTHAPQSPPSLPLTRRRWRRENRRPVADGDVEEPATRRRWRRGRNDLPPSATGQRPNPRHLRRVGESAFRSDVEAEGAQLLAAVVGDLVRAPRRHPDPVDRDVVDQALERRRWSGPRSRRSAGRPPRSASCR